MLINTVTGNENFSNSSAKVHVFYKPSRAFPGNEMFLGQMAKAGGYGHNVSTHGPVSFVSAAQGMRMEIVGKWATQTFNVPDGMIIKVFGWRQSRGLAVSAIALLKARSTAAMNRLSVQLTGNERATYAYANIEGRFDVLTPEQAVAEGCKFTPLEIKQLDPVALQRLFSITVMDAELARPVEQRKVNVKTADGTAVSYVEERKLRRIDID